MLIDTRRGLTAKKKNAETGSFVTGGLTAKKKNAATDSFVTSQ